MMDVGILAEQVFNGLMLGVIYAMIAVGFSLFFGVLDVIKFSHGDVVTVGAFSSLGAAGLAGAFGDAAAGACPRRRPRPRSRPVRSPSGVVIGRVLVMPLRNAPAINVLLATLMAGTVLREAIGSACPMAVIQKPYPALLPGGESRPARSASVSTA